VIIPKVTGAAKFSCSQVVPIVQLSPAKAAHISNPPVQPAEPGGAVKSCPTVEAAATMKTNELPSRPPRHFPLTSALHVER
jgi:hypothetical protein